MTQLFFEKVGAQERNVPIQQVDEPMARQALKIRTSSIYYLISFQPDLNPMDPRLACQLLSEPALHRVWDNPAEDQRWANL